MSTMLDYAKYGKQIKEAQEKDAGVLDALGKGATVLAGGLMAGSMLKSTYDAIKRDQKAKQVFETLSHDPMLSKVDPGTLAEWFAAIYHYSPTAASDKATAKELMHQFATFGKVDLQTLKTLADLEDKSVSARKGRTEIGGFGNSFAGNVLSLGKNLWGGK